MAQLIVESDDTLHREFKLATINNGSDMTKEVRKFMAEYVKKSKAKKKGNI